MTFDVYLFVSPVADKAPTQPGSPEVSTAVPSAVWRISDIVSHRISHPIGSHPTGGVNRQGSGRQALPSRPLLLLLSIFLEHYLIERSAFDLSRSSLLLCHINVVVLRTGMRIADLVIE